MRTAPTFSNSNQKTSERIRAASSKIATNPAIAKIDRSDWADMADEGTPGNRLTIRSSRCYLKVRQFSLGNTRMRAGIVPEEPPPDRCPDDTGAPTATNEIRQENATIRTETTTGVMAFPSREAECVMPCAQPQEDAGDQLAMARVAVGNAAPSPKPSRRRIRKRLPRPPARPVAIVVTATTSPLQNSVRRGPKRSAIQPPKIWKKAYGYAKAENARPICALERCKSD